jgi:hypothetical protein
MPFQKGNRLNPGGHRRMSPTTRRTLRDLVPVALKRLKTVLEDDDAPAAAQIAAAREILDRSHGKPVQALEVNDGRVSTAGEVSDDALTAIASRGGDGTAGSKERPPTIQ